MVSDRNGNALAENDDVTLLHVPSQATEGLPDQEIKFLHSAVGTTVIVSEIFDDEIEITLTDEEEGVIHFLRLSGHDLAKSVR